MRVARKSFCQTEEFVAIAPKSIEKNKTSFVLKNEKKESAFVAGCVPQMVIIANSTRLKKRRSKKSITKNGKMPDVVHSAAYPIREVPFVRNASRAKKGPKPNTPNKSINSAILIGYARVSTQDQNLELQRDALAKAGCRKVYEDKQSGARVERPGLTDALEMLREGDTLVVWKLDRLGRTVKQLVDLVSELQKRGVQFKSVTDSIDTSTPSGRFFFHVMASLAEMERELNAERTRAGLEVAKQLGRKGGRKPKMTASKIDSAKTLLANGAAPKDVAKDLGVSIPTLYRWIPASARG